MSLQSPFLPPPSLALARAAGLKPCPPSTLAVYLTEYPLAPAVLLGVAS
eukprot:CAMPEP_0173451040 /NCGR_PEP_ID=MMETSP1357-20121228/45963_1 /TAXON_ID=77926 /ORGANISM="Hemiselmis rufescens, Strain PCC563" /LENGTH=48 /DNA_ID= /DNA_START= /DNA_END= /DNA_ORIENTATION=